MAIDTNIPFTPINISLATISDSRSLANDKSGDYLANAITEKGHVLAKRVILKDDITSLTHFFIEQGADTNIDAVITTGGTGVTGRDVTPDALHALQGKEIPGFGELFRFLSYQKIGSSTVQSRAMAMVYNGTYYFALPGSPSACKDGWVDILSTQLDNRHKPCNFIELMPRLTEQ